MPITYNHQREPMALALWQARAAGNRNEIPVGAVITLNNKVIASAGNRTRELNDPTAHAEIIAIRQACNQLNQERLWKCSLYVTLEPCAMCAAAIAFARIDKLYYAADDAKGGAVNSGARFFASSTCHHRPEIIKTPGARSAKFLLKRFFHKLRQRQDDKN